MHLGLVCNSANWLSINFCNEESAFPFPTASPEDQILISHVRFHALPDIMMYYVGRQHMEHMEHIVMGDKDPVQKTGASSIMCSLINIRD